MRSAGARRSGRRPRPRRPCWPATSPASGSAPRAARGVGARARCARYGLLELGAAPGALWSLARLPRCSRGDGAQRWLARAAAARRRRRGRARDPAGDALPRRDAAGARPGARARRRVGPRGGVLYALNTLGGALGIAAAGFGLPALIGVRASYAVVAAAQRAGRRRSRCWSSRPRRRSRRRAAAPAARGRRAVARAAAPRRRRRRRARRSGSKCCGRGSSRRCCTTRSTRSRPSRWSSSSRSPPGAALGRARAAPRAAARASRPAALLGAAVGDASAASGCSSAGPTASPTSACARGSASTCCASSRSPP